MDNLVKEIVGVGAFGTILAYFKSIPVYLWTKVKACFTVTLDMPSAKDNYDDEVTYWLELWLAEQKENVFRRLKVGSYYTGDEEYGYKYLLSKDVVSSPGWFKYKGVHLLILCHKRISDKDGRIFYDYSATFFTRKVKVAEQFLDEIRETRIKILNNNVTSKVFVMGEWKKAKTINTRTFDSVVLPEGQAELIKKDLDDFIERKQLYLDLNITHKRGYLFEGVPGSGKSSMANVIASYLKWNLYSFSKDDMKNVTLSSAFNDIKSKSVILLEDIDTYDLNRGSEKGSGDTGDWLNWLDGINSPNDCIFVLTTNHKDRLDPALIRDGRIDFSMNFTFATEYQIRESFKRFHLSATQEEVDAFAFKHKNKDLVMADIQNDLFRLYVPSWRES